MAFPIKPLFDRVIVREIPVESYFTDKEKELLPVGHAQLKIRQYRGVVVAVGAECVSGVLPGDVVLYEDTKRYDQVFLKAIDEFMSPEVIHWQIYENDLKGAMDRTLPVEAYEVEARLQ